MRLLQTSKIELHEFFEGQIPNYAILSHRWEDGEVTFQLFQSGEGKKLPGYQKILKSCAKAASDGWEYVWIDSCCIDKSSSAELSEAINSMYKWYANSTVCYAYLCDVDTHGDVKSSLRLSQWFTRGWTLQELLAPKRMEFYDRNWIEFGTKLSISWLLTEITSIDGQILDNNPIRWDRACIAEKMSWAARRKTTRAEDLAYCLMGLFSVNMPLLYGEGARNAFIRLQTEIMAKTDDESIFAWEWGTFELPLLAEHPSWFAESGNIRRLPLEKSFRRSTGHQMTNMGVRIEVSQLPNPKSNEKLDLKNKKTFLLPLNLYKSRTSYNGENSIMNIIALEMKRLLGGEILDVDYWYRRPQLAEITVATDLHHIQSTDREIIYVPQFGESVSSYTIPSKTLIRTHNLAQFGFSLIDDNDWCSLVGLRGLQYVGQTTHGDLIVEVPKDACTASESECGLLFSDGRLRFTLLINICRYNNVNTMSFDLQPGVPSPGQDFQNMGMWKKPDIPFWISPGYYGDWSHQDRMSYCLKENLYISASVKLGRDSGDLVSIFDVEIGSQPRWVNGIKAL